MNRSTPGFLVLHYLPEFSQTHVNWVSDAIQPSHPLSPPSPALNLSQHQKYWEIHRNTFLMSQLFASGGQNFGASASPPVLSMNIQGWFPLGLTGLISLLSKELSRIFSSTVVQSISSSVLSLLYGTTLTSIHHYWKNHSFDYMDFCQQSDVSVFNTLPRFVIAFLQRSKCLLILWL